MYNSKKKDLSRGGIAMPQWKQILVSIYLVLFLGKYNSLLWTTGQTSQKVRQCLMLVDFPDFNYRQSIIKIIVFVIF